MQVATCLRPQLFLGEASIFAATSPSHQKDLPLSFPPPVTDSTVSKNLYVTSGTALAATFSSRVFSDVS